MKATCPHCGTYGPLESFLADADAKRAVVAVGMLPGEIPRLAWSYLGLWRKPGAARVLTWERVGRIVAELSALVAEAEIQWKGGRVVPNAPRYWVEAMQTMLDRDASGRLERPLENHNYLRAVAYEIAEKAWHQGNVAREKEAQHRDVGACRGDLQVAPTGGKAPRRLPPDKGGRGGCPNTGQTTYQPVPIADALKDWRKRINGETP